MAALKRRTGQQKRRLAVAKRRTAPAKRRTASKPQTPSAQARKAAEKRALEAFAQQIDPLWHRLGHECRQFAEGFNQEIGSHQLHVETNPDSVMARLLTNGAELFFQLERDHHSVSCLLNSGCTSYGSCITERPAMGLAIADGQLRFVLRGSVISEEDLAVKLLTELVELE